MLHVTGNGYVVVELAGDGEKLPPLNTPVYTEDRRRVGILLDIIGPVSRPYAVVKPDQRGLELSSGTMLYYRPPLPPRPRRGRRAAGGRGGGGRRR